jgi:hypothetical protein
MDVNERYRAAWVPAALLEAANMRRAIGTAAVSSFEKLGTRLDLDEMKLREQDEDISRMHTRLVRLADSHRELRSRHDALLLKLDNQHAALVAMTFWQRLRWILVGHRG